MRISRRIAAKLIWTHEHRDLSPSIPLNDATGIDLFRPSGCGNGLKSMVYVETIATPHRSVTAHALQVLRPFEKIISRGFMTIWPHLRATKTYLLEAWTEGRKADGETTE